MSTLGNPDLLTADHLGPSAENPASPWGLPPSHLCTVRGRRPVLLWTARCALCLSCFSPHMVPSAWNVLGCTISCLGLVLRNLLYQGIVSIFFPNLCQLLNPFSWHLSFWVNSSNEFDTSPRPMAHFFPGMWTVPCPSRLSAFSEWMIE